MNTKMITRMCMIAGAMLAAISAQAFFDAQILIDKALNSPTLTVRYSGARAALIEIRLNGVSLGTRTLSTARNAGETNFTLDLNSLRDGDNTVEVRLFDKEGRIIGTETTVVTADDGSSAPVRLTNPRVGSTVQGSVEIKVGFGREMRNSYVSFFVNDQFRSMSNTMPFTFQWDTTREANGWHELEAWVVDETSTTFKTRKVRVFVNNPGGRTDRRTAPVAAAQQAVTAVKPAVSAVPLPKLPDVASIATLLAVRVTTGAPTGLKATANVPAQTVGARLMTPEVRPLPAVAVKPVVTRPATMVVRTSTPATTTKPVGQTPSLTQMAATTALVSVTRGQKLPNIGAFSVLLNGKIVEFDVAPRVEDGVPLTPFRHLIEGAGGSVKWEHTEKLVNASADGRTISLRIGENTALVNDLKIELERTSFIDRGRTIVPLSFLRDSLGVNVQFDPKTKHVLITKS